MLLNLEKFTGTSGGINYYGQKFIFIFDSDPVHTHTTNFPKTT